MSTFTYWKEKPEFEPYRLRITIPHRGVTYFVRHTNGNTSYMGGDETPLALSNLLLGYAAETRFKLHDAKDAYEALGIFGDVLKRIGHKVASVDIV